MVHLGLQGEADSIDFAIYLYRKASFLKYPVLNMTNIQKWLYICYGVHLVLYRKRLLNESPKAWDYGPVFPRVYKAQKKHDNKLNLLQISCSVESLQKHDEVIDATLDVFGRWSTGGLIEWTHEPGKAWDKKFNHGGKYSHMDDLDILFDFKEIVTHE